MRQQIISTNQLKLFQVVCLIPWLIILGFFAFMAVTDFKIYFISQIAVYAYLFYLLYFQRILRLKSIGFDSDNFYIIEKGQEIIIPFIEVKEIKLRSLIGTHSINLYRDNGFGKELYFKSSLWYPLNFKKVDEVVYQLKSKIEETKRNYRPDNINSLGS